MLENLQNLISCMPLITVYYVALISGKVYKAHKDFKVDSNVSIKLPPEIKKTLVYKEQQKQVSESLNRYLLNFSKVIEEKMPKENLKLYTHNKKNLKVNESTKKMLIYSLFRMKILGGFYSLKNNSVNLYSHDVYKKKYYKTAPYHELFHMASSYFDQEKKLCMLVFVNFILKINFLVTV